jgi:hypothetical protein
MVARQGLELVQIKRGLESVGATLEELVSIPSDPGARVQGQERRKGC